MYHLVSILTLFLSLVVIGHLSADTQPNAVNKKTEAINGLYINGNSLHIHDGSTINLKGDLYLSKAKVTGAGLLQMTAKKAQKITSNVSQVSNLLIENPDTLTLIGQLTIENQLTVISGVFDIRKAILEKSKHTHILLIGDGFILERLPKFISKNELPNTLAFNTYQIKVIDRQNQSETFYPIKQSLSYTEKRVQFILGNFKTINIPPPKCLATIT